MNSLETNARLDIGKLPLIYCDRQLISQLFQNLIENSVKYNVNTKPYIRIQVDHSIKKNHVLIKVQDNGIGIEKEYRKQVFQMFKRLHSRKNYEGTGIGLAICKRIMEIHQGQIWIEEPYEGKGTVFALSFPI